MSVLPAAELLPPTHGRSFDASRTVRLGDVDTSGKLRLDAVARYLQDVATDDARDADLPNAMGWVVRRTLIVVERPVGLNEQVSLTTFCTGAGRSWAERRTTIVGAEGGLIEAACLWVQIDMATGRPARVGDEFFRLYGESAAGRTVSSKLQLPAPPVEAPVDTWSFRATDLDPFDHVNNAAQWAVLESQITSRLGRFELEYLAPVELGPVDLVVDHGRAWLVDDGRVLSAFAWSE